MEIPQSELDRLEEQGKEVICYFCGKMIEEYEPIDISEHVDEDGTFAHVECFDHANTIPDKADIALMRARERGFMND